MILRRKDHNASIDGKIREAMQKPMTAENLNYIGDLYLRKGEKELTIECFYNAISKLHVSQREKMIAIYKKILKVSPGDERAYRGLIDIFSKMGFVAEEVAHREALGKLYQSRGDYEKLNETYRRIYALDPGNEIAGKYFGKGKQAEPKPDFPEAHMDAEQAALLLSSHPEIGDLTDLLSAGSSGKLLEPSVPAIPAEDEKAANDRDYAEDEERVSDYQEEPPVELSSSRRGIRSYLISAVVVLMIVVAAASIFFYLKNRRPSETLKAVPVQVQPRPDKPVTAPVAEAKRVVIKVRPLSREEVDKSGIPGRSDNRTAENLFYELSFRPAGGCIPANYFMTVRNSISFVGENGAFVPSLKVQGLEKMSKIVYKSNVSGCGDNAAVYMKLWVAQRKGQNFRGIAVKGIEKDKTEILTWE